MLHMWIIWESTQESYTFYTWIILESWIGITCFKTLTCESCSHVEGTLIWLPYNSHVATIQGHCCVTTIQPVWLPCNYYVVPCNSWVATRFCVATIQLPLGLPKEVTQKQPVNHIGSSDEPPIRGVSGLTKKNWCLPKKYFLKYHCRKICPSN